MNAATISAMLAITPIGFERHFALAFEPIVDLKTGTPSHYEALTRFQPGQSPGETIKFAEELGLTDAFDIAVALKAFGVLEDDPTIGRDQHIGPQLRRCGRLRGPRRFACEKA